MTFPRLIKISVTWTLVNLKTHREENLQIESACKELYRFKNWNIQIVISEDVDVVLSCKTWRFYTGCTKKNFYRNWAIVHKNQQKKKPVYFCKDLSIWRLISPVICNIRYFLAGTQLPMDYLYISTGGLY